MKITSAIAIKNNGGGIQYQAYDSNDKLVGVVMGVEMQPVQPDYQAELQGLIDGDWSIYDACDWYDTDGSSDGDVTCHDVNYLADAIVSDDIISRDGIYIGDIIASVNF